MSGFVLSEQDRAILAEIVREYRAGRLGGHVPTAGPKAPPLSRYAPLWEVTAVGATATVQRVESDGTLIPATEIDGVVFNSTPVVGDRVILCWAGDGELYAFEPWDPENIAGYDDSQDQTLEHDENGTVVWINPTDLTAYGNTAIGSTNENEAAATDSWQRATGPVGATLTKAQVWRFAYNEAGDEKLYAFYRTEVHDAVGVYSISAETRVTIDIPEDCGT